uniref:Uncharacterized protein n=1 Tax=Rhizophora mucronata TaxID=61149 RepID=A0A2P2P2N2_RHIMU
MISYESKPFVISVCILL